MTGYFLWLHFTNKISRLEIKTVLPELVFLVSKLEEYILSANGAGNNFVNSQ